MVVDLLKITAKKKKKKKKEILPSKEKLKLVADNRQLWKRNKTNVDVIVNIKDN